MCMNRTKRSIEIRFLNWPPPCHVLILDACGVFVLNILLQGIWQMVCIGRYFINECKQTACNRYVVRTIQKLISEHTLKNIQLSLLEHIILYTYLNNFHSEFKFSEQETVVSAK